MDRSGGKIIVIGLGMGHDVTLTDALAGRLSDGGAVADLKGMWRTPELPDRVRRWSL